MNQNDFFNTYAFNGPFGKNSVFYTYSEYSLDQMNNDDNDISGDFFYQIQVFKTGSELFEAYHTLEPESKEIIILIEYTKKGEEDYNIFGTTYRVKMGEERRALMQQLEKKSHEIRIDQTGRTVNNLISWAGQLANIHHEMSVEFDINTKIVLDAQSLVDAIYLELYNLSDANKILSKVLNVNEFIAGWFYSGVEAMERWKLTEENYEYDKYKDKLKPIIPVQMFSKGDDYYLTGNKDVKELIPIALKNLKIFKDDFLKIVLPNDYLIPIMGNKSVGKQFSTGNAITHVLPDWVKKILDKLYAIIDDILELLQHGIEETFALYNALLCGIVNGLISTVQTIVWILGFLIEKASINSLVNIIPDREKLEFLEDFLEKIAKDYKNILSGLVKSFKNFGAQLQSMIDSLLEKLSKVSKYFVAFAIGGIIFELVLDVVIAFFTGGTSLAVKAVQKISRMADKLAELAQKGVKVARKAVQTVAENTAALMRGIRKFIDELLQAIKDGKFVEWIKRKFFEITGDLEGLRKMAYQDFIKAISKANLDELIQHIFEGDFGVKSSGRRKFFSAKGMHSIFGVNKKVVRIIEDSEIPPKLYHGPDTFFKAKPQLKYKNGQWINKLDNGGYSSFFPSSWTKDRILEEIAFAWKNKKVINVLKGKFEGVTTTGQKLIMYIIDGEIKTVFPLLD